MLCDNYLDLYYKGVITSRYKTHMPGKWITTFVFGSQKTYDFVHENPLVEVWGADWVNSPHIAALNDNLMSVNATMEVDLTGQCASESMDYKQFSGVGGQADFVHATARSRDGKSFLATYSTYTDKKGNLQSKIVPVLHNFITVSRVDVQYVVTEYGIAYLKDKPVKRRVEELAAIAHPDFRDWLKSEARRLNLIP
jgi:acyl-CoA hydrolase